MSNRYVRGILTEDICDIELLITSDEEYGSPISRAVIEERARDAYAVFIRLFDIV